VLCALVAAVLAVLGAPPAPAVAGDAPPRPWIDCVVISNDSYRVVFGYEKAGRRTTIPVGPTNRLRPARIDGAQPTVFQTGWQPGVLFTPPVAKAETVSWTIGQVTATASTRTRSCGQQVSLPAEGNGVGPVLVLVGSVLLSMAIAAVRGRRRPKADG
jgi:hypothetical protein